MVKRLKIALAAGGTGGHLFPAVALADAMTAEGHDAFFITERRGASFLGATPPYPTHLVESGTLSGSGIIGRIKGLVHLLKGIMQARHLVKDLQPDVVVGFGGYPALPGTIAAAIAGIPVVLHEQNALLGRANRMLASKASWIATSLPKTSGLSAADLDKVVLTGNPVRGDIRKLAASAPAETGDVINLLVTGGSLGASVLSDIVPAALASLPTDIASRLRVTHQARPADHAAVVDVYKQAHIRADVVPFIEDMAGKLADSHLVICRAGASTVAELAVIGRPAILVPLPGALDDHQTVNAKLLSDLGGGYLMPQPDFTITNLAARLGDLFSDDGVQLRRAAELALAAGKPDAANRLAQVVTAAATRAALPENIREFERIGA